MKKMKPLGIAIGGLFVGAATLLALTPSASAVTEVEDSSVVCRSANDDVTSYFVLEHELATELYSIDGKVCDNFTTALPRDSNTFEFAGGCSQQRNESDCNHEDIEVIELEDYRNQGDSECFSSENSNDIAGGCYQIDGV